MCNLVNVRSGLPRTRHRLPQLGLTQHHICMYQRYRGPQFTVTLLRIFAEQYSVYPRIVALPGDTHLVAVAHSIPFLVVPEKGAGLGSAAGQRIRKVGTTKRGIVDVEE